MIFKRIRELREENKLTQLQVSKYLEISLNTYVRYESGQRMIPTKIIARLSDLYNISIDYIAELSDCKERHSQKE